MCNIDIKGIELVSLMILSHNGGMQHSMQEERELKQEREYYSYLTLKNNPVQLLKRLIQAKDLVRVRKYLVLYMDNEDIQS